jgi:hypothetical protein
VKRLLEAAAEQGWEARRRGRFRATLERGAYSVEVVYDLSRHTRARAYRGNALSRIFASQRETVEYLKEAQQ